MASKREVLGYATRTFETRKPWTLEEQREGQLHCERSTRLIRIPSLGLSVIEA